MKGWDWVAIAGVVMVVAILGRDPKKTGALVDAFSKGATGLIATLEGSTPPGYTAPASGIG